VATSPPVVDRLADQLTALGWVTDLLVAGSLATGDYTAGISDLHLVAVVDAPLDPTRQAHLSVIHRHLDGGREPV
jgi:hypothetical protein